MFPRVGACPALKARTHAWMAGRPALREARCRRLRSHRAAPRRAALRCQTVCCLPAAVQGLSSWRQAEEAGVAVGFKLLHSRDVAEQSKEACTPW